MNDSPRKLYLAVTLKLLLLCAGLILLYVFVASLRSVPEESRNRRAGVEVDLIQLGVGKIKIVEAFGQVIWILRRGEQDQALLVTNNTNLRDAVSAASRQPDNLRTPERSLLGEFFVFVPFETKRHCRVSWTPAQGERPGEFIEPCYGARFDSAGRIYKGSGDPQQRNLTVPKYERLSDSRIRLLPPG